MPNYSSTPNETGSSSGTAPSHNTHFHVYIAPPKPVGIKQNLLASDAGLDQTQGVAADELANAAQALLNQVQPHLNFDQGDLAMFVMDTPPDVPPQYAPVVIAQASQAKQETMDRTVGVCQLIVNDAPGQGTAVNGMSPAIGAINYFRIVEQRDIELPGTVSVLKNPEHGILKNVGEENYLYYPAPGYVGEDRATYLVDIGGYHVKMVYFFHVQNTPVTDYDDQTKCPKPY